MEAQAECRFLMLAHNNILKPQDGKPVMQPSQDMVIGCYYLTMTYPKRENLKPEEIHAFSNYNEAMMAYQTGHITLQQPIRVRVTRSFEGKTASRLIDCTLGMSLSCPLVRMRLWMLPSNGTPQTQVRYAVLNSQSKSNDLAFFRHCKPLLLR